MEESEKKLAYETISKNIDTWINYSKAKGAPDTNHENGSSTLRMEIRVKLKAREKEHQQKKKTSTLILTNYGEIPRNCA